MMDPRLAALAEQALEAYKPRTKTAQPPAKKSPLRGRYHLNQLGVTVDTLNQAVAELNRSTPDCNLRFDAVVVVLGERMTFRDLVARAAEECGEPHVADRIRGTRRPGQRGAVSP